MDNYQIYKAYAGTGNIDVPEHISQQIKRLAGELETNGYILRTGGLDGSEQAFDWQAILDEKIMFDDVKLNAGDMLFICSLIMSTGQR